MHHCMCQWLLLKSQAMETQFFLLLLFLLFIPSNKRKSLLYILKAAEYYIKSTISDMGHQISKFANMLYRSDALSLASAQFFFLFRPSSFFFQNRFAVIPLMKVISIERKDYFVELHNAVAAYKFKNLTCTVVQSKIKLLSRNHS